MKNNIIGVVVMALALLTACNTNQRNETESDKTETHEHDHNGHEHDDHDHLEGEVNSTNSMTLKQENISVQKIITDYIVLKNTLVNDDADKAADAGSLMVTTLSSINTTSFTEEQLAVYNAVVDDLIEQAEHIGENASDITHQREHFEMMSKDVLDLLIVFGSDVKLYQVFCPMYNNNLGGMWLSESKEIQNPYYGAKMLKCGSVKKEF